MTTKRFVHCFREKHCIDIWGVVPVLCTGSVEHFSDAYDIVPTFVRNDTCGIVPTFILQGDILLNIALTFMVQFPVLNSRPELADTPLFLPILRILGKGRAHC